MGNGALLGAQRGYRFGAALIVVVLVAALAWGAAPGWAAGFQFHCDGLPADLTGTSGSERLVGSDGADVIVGLGGNDTIIGLRGNDTLCGGADEVLGNDK